MIFFIRKSTLEKLQNKNDSFEKIKAEIIAHLRKIENKENNLNKAIKALEEDEKSISHFEKSINGEWIEKAGYGVGTVRVWRGKKYKKISTKPNRWVRVYDKTSRGAKNAITRLIHKAEKIESPEEMMQFVLLNKQRFMDSNGKPLDIVDRLQKVIDAKNTEYDSKISNEKKKYKKLQEELKEEIASGKRNNTKELQEDVDEWKNLLAVATKNPNSPYSKEQAEHFKEIIKIGEEELNRRNKKMTKKKTETKNKDVITERIDVKDFQKKIEEEKYLNKLLSYKIEDVRKLDNKDLLNTIAAKTYNYRKGDMGAAIKNANTWAEKGRLEILAKFFDDKEAQKKIDKAENDEEINYSLNKIKKSKTIGEKINNFGGLIQYLENILNFEPMFTLLSFDKKPTFDLSATKVNKINELLNSYGDKKIEQNVKSVLNELKAYNGREFTVDELLGKESEIEEHNNRSEAMKGNQNAKKDFKDLASIIKNKASLNLENDNIGEVNLTYDVNKSDLKHIIERRYSELKNKYHVEGENERRKLLTSFVFSLLQTIKHGSATLQKDGRSYILKHNGISAIARQNKAGKIVVTGFVDNSNEKEGAETIAAVNADYGYTPEFLELYAQVGATLPTNNDTMNKENVNKKRADNENPKTLSDIRKHYETSKSITGRKKTVTLPNGDRIKCHYKLVEAETPTASHDEITFSPTQGFPQNENGKNINDRDYFNDRDAQESVRKIASNFNSLALESPPIVTKDGIVISGNNRTMSSKLAARNGTDTKYLSSLKEDIDEYGLDEDDLKEFKNPRLILEVDEEHKGNYTTDEFAVFNKDTKKTMNNVEKAVKLTKTLNADKIKNVADCVNEYETMGELYQDKKGGQRFVEELIKAGVIMDNEKAQYLTSDGLLNDTGKDFVETVLVGSVLNEDNIRGCDSAGGKKIRQKLVRAILPLIENKGNGKEYSFNNELNEAVSIALTVSKNHDTYPTVKTYLAQGTLFNEKKPDEITSKLAEIIHDEGEKAFASRMKGLGAGLRDSADGNMDIFLGGVETKDSLMRRFLDLKKAISEVMENLFYKEKSLQKTVADILRAI